MKKKRLGLAVVALVVLVATPILAITFGVPDGDDHPYVGTLLFIQDGYGYYSCTGTLLSPTVMLTAGHCVEGELGVNDITWVNFMEEIPDWGPGGISDAYLNNPSNGWMLASGVIPHPQFTNFSEFPQTYDVGLVFLEQPIPMDTYGTLPEAGFLETLVKGRARRNRRFTAVGYGRQGVLNPFYGRDYARYQGEVSLIELNSTFAGGHSAKFTNNPGGGNGVGGTCFGDSGGPIFWGDTNIIGAIVSWGITPCIGVDYQFRMDTPLARNFVLDNLP